MYEALSEEQPRAVGSGNAHQTIAQKRTNNHSHGDHLSPSSQSQMNGRKINELMKETQDLKYSKSIPPSLNKGCAMGQKDLKMEELIMLHSDAQHQEIKSKLMNQNPQLKSPKFNCSPDVKLRKAAYSDNLNKNRLGVGHFPTENFKSELDDSPPIKYKNTEEAGKPIFKINLFQYTHDKEGSLTENEKQGSQPQAGNQGFQSLHSALEESINNIEEFSNSIVQSPKKTKGIQSVKSTPIIFKEGQKKIKDVDFNKLVQNSGYKKLQFNRFSAGSFKDSDHEQSNEKRQQIEGCIEEEKKANCVQIDNPSLIRKEQYVKKELSAPKDKQVLTNCSVNESQYFLDNSLLPNNLTGKTSHGKLDNKLDEIRLLKKKTRNVEKAIILFNNSRILETLKFLIKIEAVTSDAVEIKSEHDLGNEQANEFASFLYETTGLDKNKIGEFLGKNKPFNLLVLSQFFTYFSFKNMIIDMAMRRAFKSMRLPKEFQEIERIIYAFAREYYLQNKDFLKEHDVHWNEESVELLAMSILILNTNIHSDKIPKSLKLSKQSFVKTNQQILNDIVSSKFLVEIYDRIVQHQFESKIDLQEKFFKRVNDIDQLPNERTRQELLKEKGTVFTKYGRYGLPHKRLVQLSDDDTLIQWKDPKKSKEKLRQLCTEDIVSIMIGADHTKVMKKQKIPVEYDNFCMSIITKKRSLDLRFDDQKVIQVWSEKIKGLISYNQEIKIQTDIQTNELNRFQRSVLREAIDDIWRSEILLNWQNYWDPMRKKIKNLKVILHLDGEEKQRITKQLNGFQEQTLVTQDLEKKIKSLPRDYFTNLFYLWHEGLPNFARVCIWPIVIGNPLQIQYTQYKHLKNQLNYLRSQFKLQYENHQSRAMGAQEELQSSALQLNQQEEYLGYNYMHLNKIRHKAQQQCFKVIQSLAEFDIDEELFQDIMESVLSTFALYRPDIGYIKGLEKLLAQILLVQLPYQDYSTPDFSLVALEQEIFSLFSNLVLSIGHLPYFLINDIDEVAWRLKFFDTILEKEIPDLATHFKAINMQSQLYLYDWMLQLFVSVLPVDIVWRLWDIFFMKGEVFIYQAALGYLKYNKHWLLGNPMSHCLQVFKKTRQGEGIEEEPLFESINSIQLTMEEFEESKGLQMVGRERATIYKLFI